MSENLLIIFVRNPELGKVKTRLAKTIGDQKALDIYNFLLDRTKEITKDLNCVKAVFYTHQIEDDDIWERKYFEKEVQFGFDLGIKMKNAFQTGFENNYKKVVLIGSDLYDLTPSHIDEAFNQLSNNDTVIGPAKDGGYYLIGLKKILPKIFKNKSWGTNTVLTETLEDLQNRQVHLLQELNDIDVQEDIQNHPALSQFLSTT